VEHIDATNLIVVPLAMAIAAGIRALFRCPVPGVLLADFGLGMLFLAAEFEMDPYVLRADRSEMPSSPGSRRVTYVGTSSPVDDALTSTDTQPS
jgi:hypothetical protein